MSEEKNTEQQELEIPFFHQEEEKPAEKRKKRGFHIPAPAWFAIGCAAVLAGVLIFWNVSQTVLGKEISLLDATQPVFGGYSGGGYIAEDFAPENNALRLLNEEMEKRQRQGKSTDALQQLIDSVSCSFEKANGYTNNENLIYACSYNTAAAESAGIRLKDTMKTYTVSGLAEYAVLDVFAGVSADWQIAESGLSIGLSIPQELLDMGISYSYSYGGESYNGETISIHAEFDQNVLRSYGYVVETDEITYPLGAMPEQITDTDELTDEEKAYLRDTLKETLENEITACGNRAVLSSFTGSYSIEITEIGSAYIEKTAMSHFDGSGRFRITFELETNSDFILQDIGSFSASFTGSIYRMPDGSIRFLTNTVHACEFSGYFGSYSLKETDS